MKKIYVMLNVVFAAILFYACGNNGTQKNTQPQVISDIRNNMEKVNKFLSEKDNDRIESFLHRHNLQATFNEAGFWIARIEDSNGKEIENGSLVELKCKIYLLDGTLCYQYDEENPLVFVVNKSNELSERATAQNVVSGLHSALTLMKESERAVFIFPPHLAHGIIGDGNNIPPRSILVYDVKILETKTE